MKLLKSLSDIFVRFRYPISLPQDIASDLGYDVSNSMNFNEFILHLTDPCHRPAKLSRFMPRDQAEDVFRLAKRKERFSQDSLFSYQFKNGWLEFILQFDEKARLRRLYIHHKDLKQKHEILISQ